MLRYAAPPGYRREKPIRRPKLDPYTGIINQILLSDEALPKKQRHTARRIKELLVIRIRGQVAPVLSYSLGAACKRFRKAVGVHWSSGNVLEGL